MNQTAWESWMHQIARALMLALGLSVAGPAAAQTAAAPRRILLFIGDGAGASYWTAAGFAADKLAVEEFPVMGLVDTRATDYKVTDSAASATAYASGVRTYNGAIGVAPDSTAVTTILEMATERGLSTGLVATSRITHATPASFASHVPSRAMEVEIARQMIQEQDVTVLIGGGHAWFDGTRRPDSLDLLREIADRYTYVTTPEAFLKIDVTSTDRLFALLTESHMPAAVQATLPQVTHQGVQEDLPAGSDTTWAPWRAPTLAQMTATALGVLDKNPDGFFLMVEASQPDWRGHGNEPLRTIVAEMLDFDAAIGEGLAYQRRHPETLIVVVADHETGGLAIQYDSTATLVARYTTGSHTAQMIPLFAKGPGAEQFGGIQYIDEIGRRLIDHLTRECLFSPNVRIPCN